MKKFFVSFSGLAKCLAGFAVLSALLCGFSGCKKAGKNVSASSGMSQESEKSSGTVSVKSVNQSSEEILVSVPKNASRVVVLDLAVLDILDNLSLGDKIVGSVSTRIDYLEKYSDDEKIAKCGTVKEVDLEKILSVDPEIIFAGARLQTIYGDLSEIAPTILFPSLTSKGLYEGVKENAFEIAKIWGKEDEVSSLTEDFASRISGLKKKAEGKTAIVGLCTNGGFSVLGDKSRCSIIGNEIGFKNIGIDFAAENSRSASRGARNATAAMHGNEVSFEFVVKANPDYIFVLDRDSAIGAKGAKLASEILDNELVNSTSAARNGNLVILEHPEVWYTAEGGITAFDIMLEDLENRIK